jgi:hypothetical protein
MNWDLKSVAEVITSVAALVAAIQSWRSAGKSEKAREGVEDIRNEIRNEIKTTLSTVLQHTQTLQQNQTHTQQVNIHLPATAGAALRAPNSILLGEQPGQTQDAQQEPGQPEEGEQQH